VSSVPKLIIALLATANLIALGALVLKHYPSAMNTPAQGVSNSQRLPLIDLRNDQGAIVNTKSFAGSTLFVQFINPYIEAQINSFLRVYGSQPSGDRSVSWLLVTEDVKALRERLAVGIEHVTVVGSGYQELKSQFGAPSCCESWVIFDPKGNRRASGKYDETGASDSLSRVLAGEKSVSQELTLEKIKSLCVKENLAQFSEQAASAPSQRTVVAMISTLCTSCGDGKLIDILSDKAKIDKKNAYFALVPDSFDQVAIDNLKTNLDLPFPVLKASRNFSQEWLSLNDQIGEKHVNGTILVVSNGKVEKIVNGIGDTRRLLTEIGE
jgi:hypothetical protein